MRTDRRKGLPPRFDEPMVRSAREAICSLVDREPSAWAAKDVEALVDLYHPEMVWTTLTEDEGKVGLGSLMLSGLDADRWRAAWKRHFATHDLVHHEQETCEVHVAEDGSGGFAIVERDALWREKRSGEVERWNGRALKIYTREGSGWRMRAHWELGEDGSLEDAVGSGLGSSA